MRAWSIAIKGQRSLLFKSYATFSIFLAFPSKGTCSHDVMYPSSNRVWACAADPRLWGVDSGIGSETGAAEGGVVGGAVSMVV